jgi:hypothetical protein
MAAPDAPGSTAGAGCITSATVGTAIRQSSRREKRYCQDPGSTTDVYAQWKVVPEQQRPEAGAICTTCGGTGMATQYHPDGTMSAQLRDVPGERWHAGGVEATINGGESTVIP